jgi:hypothetical protein
MFWGKIKLGKGRLQFSMLFLGKSPTENRKIGQNLRAVRKSI